MSPSSASLAGKRSGKVVELRTRANIVAVGGVVLLAAVVRSYRLGAQSFWLDEAYTFARAAVPIDETISASIEKSHVPTYFVAMHYWIAAFGDSEAALRAPSAICGVLTVGAVMVLCWIAVGRRPALLAGLLIALSPLQVHYAQEARMYTMFTLSATIAMCGIVWLLKHPHRAAIPLWCDVRQPLAQRVPWLAWFAYVTGASATLYLHNAGVFLLATCGVCTLQLVRHAEARRLAALANCIIVHVAIVLIWSAWIRFLLLQTGKVMRQFWPEFPTLGVTATTLGRLYLLDVWRFPWLAGFVAALFAAGIWAMRKERLVLHGLLALALLPPVLVLIVSVHTPMLLPRIILWAPVPFAVLAAAGAFAWPRRGAAGIAAAIVLTGGLLSLGAYYTGYGVKAPWHRVARIISERYDNDTVVFATGSQERTCLNYYFNRRHAPIERVPIYTVRPSQVARYLSHAETALVIDRKNGTRARAMALRGAIERHGVRLEEQRSRAIVLTTFRLVNAVEQLEEPAEANDDEDRDELPDDDHGA